VEVMQWLFWQVGGLGPMAGQNHHFVGYAGEPIPYAIDRYVRETGRLYAVLNKRLADRDYVAGDSYTIADMACYPWTVSHERQRQNLDDFPNLKRWYNAIADRPATQRAYALGPVYRAQATMTEAEKKILFGQSAATVR
ncbi:MAG: glutathione binding-like protein, partial [Betaproteobacteria bacterium]